MPQAWMPYVQVANADQTVEKAKRLGATIHVAGDDVPGIGRIAILEDTQHMRDDIVPAFEKDIAELRVDLEAQGVPVK